MKNTYKKYCPNVFVACCDEEHKKGDVITLTTKYGKENEHYVHNFLGKNKDGKFLYSITRVDEYNHAKSKVEKIEGYMENAQKRADYHYNKSQKDLDFLVLGEPIKVGHHSEKRHRKMYEDMDRSFGKSVEETKKVEQYKEKIEYYKNKGEEINLSMPESLEYFRQLLEEKTQYHAKMKSGEITKEHCYSLTYAKKEVNETKKKLELAKKLWG